MLAARSPGSSRRPGCVMNQQEEVEHAMRQNRQKGQQAGFTLVELSVVLVVIGLLIVSVLKGAGMIHEAKVRKTAQMVEDIRTASNLFYREQGRLPGDGGVGGMVAGTVVNGLIVGVVEIDAFKEELIKGGYLKGAKDAVGKWFWSHPLNGVIWVEATASRNFIVLTNVTADDQKFFDIQFDGDDDPLAGPVRFSTYLKIYL